MKHVKTLSSNTLKNSMKKGGCGECQTSCQSACKTSCTVGNQSCENSNRYCGAANKRKFLKRPLRSYDCRGYFLSDQRFCR